MLIESDTTGPWAQFNGPNDNSPLQFLSKSPSGGGKSPVGSTHLPGLGSVLPPMMTSSAKVAPIGKDQHRFGHTEQVISMVHGGGNQLSHSFPDHSDGLVTPGSLSSFGPSTPNASGVGSLTGPQFLWGNSTSYKDNTKTCSWQPQGMGSSMISNGLGPGKNFLYPSSHGSFLGSSHNQHLHHVGSAPSVVPFEKQFGYISEPQETSSMSQFAFGNIGINRNGGSSLINVNSRSTMNQGIISGNMPDSNSPDVRMMPAQRFGPIFGPYPGLSSIGIDNPVEWNRNRRIENQGSQADNKKLFQLDLEKIIKGEDARTTIMIKNIPNKYKS